LYVRISKVEVRFRWMQEDTWIGRDTAFHIPVSALIDQPREGKAALQVDKRHLWVAQALAALVLLGLVLWLWVWLWMPNLS
jgi:hypothetical protein